MGLGLGARRLAAQPQPGPPAQAAADDGAFGPLNLSGTGRGGGAQSPHAVSIAAPKGATARIRREPPALAGPGRLDG